MAKSCGGLPISIVVLARILANKDKSHREWSKVMDHVNLYLTRPETQVLDIVLKLSYDSLPSRLRPCFPYFGMFPEDYEIPIRSLIQLWVAEGFIRHSDPIIVEDVAKDCVDELIDRSLIQVGRRRSDGGIKTCRIHDSLRELCISESMEEKLFEVCRDTDILKQSKPSRLSIQCNMFDYFASSNKDHSSTRSMLCFDDNSHYLFDSSESKRFLKCLQLVRVLDLSSSNHNKIPANLGMFIHLKIELDHVVDGRILIVIPQFICNLWNLETLDLGRGLLYDGEVSFPIGIWKLKRLRHLHTPAFIILPEFPDVKGQTMWNLQTLSHVGINKKSAIMSLIGRGVFPKLRRLGLRFSEDDTHKQGVGQVWENLANLNYLNALKIYDFPDIPSSVNAFLSNLTELTVSSTNLNSDVMSILGSLANLRILRLYFCKVGKRWEGAGGASLY
ncbi:putative late blight resistance protein homolog R1A-10 [Neltuma alba]|uniref:putative late blight resistance protein homolog R1A-10 n=1 Tax=Neltuma alba TaxID=207710 RepID=UPI0010A4F1AD|nr:putative late blight resistance protein homolog R1A-10 [Prosopis alba]